jgi:hypothetical protein
VAKLGSAQNGIFSLDNVDFCADRALDYFPTFQIKTSDGRVLLVTFLFSECDAYSLLTADRSHME